MNYNLKTEGKIILWTFFKSIKVNETNKKKSFKRPYFTTKD